MSTHAVKKKIRPKRTKWDEAISDAKKKIHALKFTISVYRKRKKAGEPWPTDSAAQPTSST